LVDAHLDFEPCHHVKVKALCEKGSRVKIEKLQALTLQISRCPWIIEIDSLWARISGRVGHWYLFGSDAHAGNSLLASATSKTPPSRRDACRQPCCGKVLHGSQQI